VIEMPVDISDLMGGDAPTDADLQGTVDDNNAESDAGALDHPQGEKELYEDLTGAGDDDSDDVDTGDAPKPRKQLVPLGALQEERNKRQELQQQLTERAAQQDKLAERLARLLEQQQQLANPAPEPEVIPDFDEDPRGHVDGLRRQFEQQLEQLRQFAGGQNQANQQAQQFQQVQHRVAADEQVYRATNPDYNDAAQYFNDRKLAEYTALGMDNTTARQQLARDVYGVAQIAYQQGKNPAEVLHNLAKAFGFTGKPPTPGNGGGNGGGAPAAPKAPNTSLSSLEGSARAPDEKGKLTAAQIADMPDKDFDELFARMGRDASRSNRIKF
jgi:hypothetical protein